MIAPARPSARPRTAGARFAPCRPAGVVPYLCRVALLSERFDAALLGAPAWVQDRASSVGWRPLGRPPEDPRERRCALWRFRLFVAR